MPVPRSSKGGPRVATELRLDARLAQWGVQAGARTLATFAAIQGLNILVSPRARWEGPSFSTALSMPGAPPSWGVVIIAAGLLMLTGSLLGRLVPVIIGSWISATWCTFFAFSFAKAALDVETAGTTGFFAYAGFAVLFMGVATIYSTSRKIQNATSVCDERE